MQPVLESLGKDPEIALAFVLGSLAILGATAVLVAGVVSWTWRRVREADNISALKHDMLERGMGAEEIARVIEVAPARRFGCGGKSYASVRLAGGRAHG